MYIRKRVYFILLSAIVPLITACTPHTIPPEEGGYYYHGIYFGAHLTPMYKKGIRDGCKTAKGFYKKSHYLFNNNNHYYNGWFLGRSKCRHLLRIDEEGNLVSD